MTELFTVLCDPLDADKQFIRPGQSSLGDRIGPLDFSMMSQMAPVLPPQRLPLPQGGCSLALIDGFIAHDSASAQKF